mmetsp:Transcript_51126/g.136682  ORF Transcript_51126/g.136682 Transcript_51126/m.136682 type:complete len:109 (-) Transcript_51126:291-617(-)
MRFAAPVLRCERDFVLSAVRRRGLALEFVSEELRGDRQLVLAASCQDAMALWHAKAELRCDRELLTAVVALAPSAQPLRWARDWLDDDPEFEAFLEAVALQAGKRPGS